MHVNSQHRDWSPENLQQHCGGREGVHSSSARAEQVTSLASDVFLSSLHIWLMPSRFHALFFRWLKINSQDN